MTTPPDILLGLSPADRAELTRLDAVGEVWGTGEPADVATTA